VSSPNNQTDQQKWTKKYCTQLISLGLACFFSEKSLPVFTHLNFTWAALQPSTSFGATMLHLKTDKNNLIGFEQNGSTLHEITSPTKYFGLFALYDIS